MARLFSTTFNYKEETFPALETITGSGPDKKVTIKVQTEQLNSILPGGKVELNYQDCMQKSENEVNHDIIHSLALAIKAHEIKRPPTAL